MTKTYVRYFFLTIPNDACSLAFPGFSLSWAARAGGRETALLRELGIPRLSVFEFGISNVLGGRDRGTDCAPVADAAGTMDEGGLIGREAEEGGRPGLGWAVLGPEASVGFGHMRGDSGRHT
jgi:hypothetical protein